MTEPTGINPPPIADAITTGWARDPKANALLHSAREELKRADAAAHRAMNCVNKVERQRGLNAAIDHTKRAVTLLLRVNI